MPDHTPFFPENLEDYAPWVTIHGLVAPYGECQCGCGKRVRVVNSDDKRYGRLKGMPTRFLRGHSGRIPIETRFWSNIEKSINGCWLWTGTVNDYGYGLLHTGGHFGSAVRAHRVSYELHYGLIPQGMKVLHRCDTPSCVNPNHLFLGTHADNSDDKVKKGRQANGNRLPQARLTESSVKDIRELHEEGIRHADLARKFGVSDTTIRRVISRRVWGHVK